MLKIVRSEETSQIAVVTASKQINRHYRSKKKKNLKDKSNELAIISKDSNFGDLCIEQ
jgi:hypothetical protein